MVCTDLHRYPVRNRTVLTVNTDRNIHKHADSHTDMLKDTKYAVSWLIPVNGWRIPRRSRRAHLSMATPSTNLTLSFNTTVLEYIYLLFIYDTLITTRQYRGRLHKRYYYLFSVVGSDSFEGSYEGQSLLWGS